MRSTANPILLCASQPREDVRALLSGAGYRIHCLDLTQAETTDLPDFDLVLIDATRQREHALRLCRGLSGKKGDQSIPILMLARGASPRARLDNLASGADGYILHPFEPDELLTQVRSYQRVKERHDHLLAKTAEADGVNKKLQAVCSQIDQELELARRLQQSFLPHSLPEFPRLQFAVHYAPCGRVGGDFYDVFRLDECHVGFYVADAMGHGVPASLLTIFVKRGVKGKEINGQDYRLVQPDEVLQKLNRDLIEQDLSDQPFVTMAYALFNFHEGLLRFARSGHPYPLYLPSNGPPNLWQIEGKLLGIFETQFPMQTHQLQTGDKVIFYSDGLDAGVFDDHPAGSASLLAAAERFRDLPITELLPRLAEDLFRKGRPNDDLTLLGMEYR